MSKPSAFVFTAQQRTLMDLFHAYAPGEVTQYASRICELRAMGIDIRNRTKKINGKRHSWYRLVEAPAPSTSNHTEQLFTSPGYRGDE